MRKKKKDEMLQYPEYGHHSEIDSQDVANVCGLLGERGGGQGCIVTIKAKACWR